MSCRSRVGLAGLAVLLLVSVLCATAPHAAAASLGGVSAISSSSAGRGGDGGRATTTASMSLSGNSTSSLPPTHVSLLQQPQQPPLADDESAVGGGYGPAPRYAFKCTDIMDNDDPCLFVTMVEDCQNLAGRYNYLFIPFCSELHNEPQSGSLLGLLVIYLFLALGWLADEILCPSFSAVVHRLELEPSQGGAMLLALSSSIPKILVIAYTFPPPTALLYKGHVYAAMDGMLGSMLINSGLNAGLLLTTLVFSVDRFALVRDLALLAAVVGLLLYPIHDGKLTSAESTGFLCLFSVYLTVFVAGAWRRWRAAVRTQDGERQHLLPPQQAGDSSRTPAARTPSAANRSVNSNPPQRTQATADSSCHYGAYGTIVTLTDGGDDPYEDVSSFPGWADQLQASNQLESPPDYGSQRKAPIDRHEGQQPAPSGTFFSTQQWRTVAKVMSPFRMKDWKEAGVFGKFIILLKAPCVLVFKLFIPIYAEDETNNHWNRIVAVWHALVTPAFCMFLVNVPAFNSDIFEQCAVWMLMPVLCIPLAIFVWCTSNYDRPPKYFLVFGAAGFVASAIALYAIQNELVNALMAIAKIININDTLIDSTVLFWGVAIADLVTQVTVAKYGLAELAFFAGLINPILTMALGMGMGGLMASSANDAPFVLESAGDTQLTLSAAFGLANVGILAIGVPQCKFTSHRWFGLGVVVCYFGYLLTCVMIAAVASI
ncbi:hypothetical protein CAOG_08931 [Capsaspora owczarzaki ATCC 30864]|uniref:Sodium/calcium exchanger membrane region domain-containing protein n=1 Tax=Capsaspora owczarzaki (strain ATCC 30864) TaxID=595528 RepID=A0A0D2VVV7_CAPO3|nr:hypothetical protein CAOG_08931 [Capsaspora owczarzaki ATCC 30864]KJE95602.1 hypothetical protein CAOG_008931 [Capsaspora owczarzaki ATCC 30864]|eukprot:XP_011270602.1 hypothetical protein CAOG_08931 [Capsaspora owczarzaki ATCC 30864]